MNKLAQKVDKGKKNLPKAIKKTTKKNATKFAKKVSGRVLKGSAKK